MTSKLIVALDIDNKNNALHLIDKLDPALCALKIGSEMFTLWGPAFVKQLTNKGYKVFLDLKFHDIPHTVGRACKAGADLGVWMLNVHAAGGKEMMQAAVSALEPYGKERPLLIAVTVLTSFDEETLASTGVSKPLEQHVTDLAQLVKDSRLDGVVCSAYEVPLIKQRCGNTFITVTPGIRLPNNLSNDQVRIMTPKEAVAVGSDFLVIGRPITRSENPLLTIKEIINDME
jgi:orotidine-5'-phosphate decarboxylase